MKEHMKEWVKEKKEYQYSCEWVEVMRTSERKSNLKITRQFMKQRTYCMKWKEG